MLFKIEATICGEYSHEILLYIDIENKNNDIEMKFHNHGDLRPITIDRKEFKIALQLSKISTFLKLLSDSHNTVIQNEDIEIYRNDSEISFNYDDIEAYVSYETLEQLMAYM